MKFKEDNIIIIEEEVRIPDTDIILEKGDRISVVEASYDGDEDKSDSKKNDEEDDEKDDDEVVEKKKKK